MVQNLAPKRSRRKPSQKLGTQLLKRPSIARHTDYRIFLREMFAYRKSAAPAFSYRSFAESTGVLSAPYLNMVLHGKRNLSPDAVQAVAKAVGLSAREAKLFESLVTLNQASSSEQHVRQLKKLVRKRSFRESTRLDGNLLAFLENWEAVAIHALADLPAFQDDPEWITARFPMMSRLQAKRAVRVLYDLGLLRREKSGKIVSTSPQLSTLDEVRREVVRFYHSQMLKLSARALELLPTESRNFGAVTMRIPRERFADAVAYVHEMRNQLFTYLGSLETVEADAVVQANIQFFPLTDLKS